MRPTSEPLSSARRRVCRGLVIGLIGLLARPMAAGAETGLEKADLILVLKRQRKLLLMRDGKLLKSFPIALGAHPRRPKHAEGDGRTPEGLYWIDGRNDNSPYRLSLHLSYPDRADEARARAAHLSPGGDIAIHGMSEDYGDFDPVTFITDWTDGCIAVGNRAIDEIGARVDIGTPVEIWP